ncbi:unnamed protein product [Thlaspi arvense]|uniref:Transglutaminase-like domain-containing protein n=1 Tax=Thlaspi arvense TaxID=13288 RepID=A0AAU9RJM1_THLAR|nr:unnamed protein product [Thlaspi arvense]
MVARKFVIRHEDSSYGIDYDTENGLEVLQIQIFSITSVPPDEQKIVAEDDDRVVSDETDLASISGKLRLLSTGGISEEKSEGTSGKSEKSDAEMLQSDEEFARMLQAEEEAMMFQQYVAAQDSGEFERRIRPYVSQVLMYEDPVRQEAARKTIPKDELEEKALVSLAKEGNFEPSKDEKDYAFLLQLLFWFKRSFRWVNEPSCDYCGNKTIGQGMGNPLTSELAYGANRVELYRCTSCPTITRFPRYNDPLKLVETKRGRCGEWANCFTLYCRSFGYDSRLIMDFTDHVWTECFSHSLGRWIHLDPCEGVYDKPMLYEKGWGKKLNYVTAISKDGVCDVTKRYTKKWNEVLSRRTLTTESSLQAVLRTLTTERRSRCMSEVLSALKLRDSNEQEELERNLHSPDDNSVSLPGRQSGDKEWRILRSEFGSDENSSVSSSSCPVRTCVDNHVTNIYDSFLPILTQFVEDDLPVARAIEVLNMIKKVLVDLKNASFKTRKARLSLDSDSSSSIPEQFLPALEGLLLALSLKSEKDADDKSLTISLVGEPTKTALALPVALDALKELVTDLSKCQNLNKDSLSFPILKQNRVCSGSVLASGEELPSGIATAAFDGIQESKWEEPNGAKGCWIVYKTLYNQMQQLIAYELMSANDAPERDPKDWVLEGSSDSGSTWHVLDKQTCQVFEERFQRKSYKITSPGFQANLFRFRFLCVRDVNSTSRLQLGSIDLYRSQQ